MSQPYGSVHLVPPRDAQRSRVYAVEHQLARTLDRGGGSPVTLEVMGSTLTMPAQRRFGDLDGVRRYVDGVLALAQIGERWPEVPPVSVRRRRDGTAAHYEPPGTLALHPDAGWGMRELVVLHELAHHLVWHEHAGQAASHGREFTDALAFLAGAAMAPEVGFVLRAWFDESGLGWSGREAAESRARSRPAAAAAPSPQSHAPRDRTQERTH